MRIKSSKSRRVICLGLGSIGLETCRLIRKSPGLMLVGLIDKDPAKIGMDYGLGLKIEGNMRACILRTQPDIAFLMTTSRFPVIVQDIKTLAGLGLDVVSSCEELSFPWLMHKKSADELDRMLRRLQRKAIGTGVNPGFVMDMLPLTLANVCQSVESIRVARVVDVSKRRLQLQRKMAVGLSKQEFRRRLRRGKIGHAGLKESAALIAAGMGWRLNIRETIRPIVKRGRVVGIAQTAIGEHKGRKKVILELSMSWKNKDPRDELHIAGTPPVHAKISPGVQGDLATAACLVNAALKLDRLPCGLLTVKDLPAGVN